MRFASVGLLVVASCSQVTRGPAPAPESAPESAPTPTPRQPASGLAELPAPRMDCPKETVPRTRGTTRDGESGCVRIDDPAVWHGPYAAWKCEPIDMYRPQCLRERGQFVDGLRSGRWQTFDVYGHEIDVD